MRKFLLLAVLLICFTVGFTVQAQDAQPSLLVVGDQFVFGMELNIPEIHLDQDGFVVIHVDNDGAPGPVAGFRYLAAGWYLDLKVEVDTTMLTPTVFPMLHYDTNANGEYEFAGGELDGPVIVDGSVLVAPMAITVINADDQIADGSLTAMSVTIDQPGFLVVHIQQDGGPGPVLGTVLLEPGTTNDVVVEFTNNDILPTNVLYPMLHYDTDNNGVYEFAGGELDGIVVTNGQPAFAPIWTVAHMRAEGQVIIYSDLTAAAMGAANADPAVFHAHSVLLDQDGFLVVHISQDGGPGPVAGVVFLEAGFHEEVEVPLDMMDIADVTTGVFPMLHYDTDSNGVYEFAGGELDGIVVVDGEPQFFAVNIAPSFVAAPQAVSAENTLTFSEVLADAPGFFVIHDDNGGSPGPVLGVVRVHEGLNRNVVVTLDQGSPSTTTVFPMLHYDTNLNGTYEFAGGELDGPTIVRGAVVVGPLDISGQ
jgi:hypothetical protein